MHSQQVYLPANAAKADRPEGHDKADNITAHQRQPCMLLAFTEHSPHLFRAVGTLVKRGTFDFEDPVGISQRTIKAANLRCASSCHAAHYSSFTSRRQRTSANAVRVRE
jgi:hypothetical protein